MFGSNYLGQPSFGQGYAGLLGIQFNSTANSGYQAASNSYSWSHIIENGPRQILVVSVGLLSVTNSVTSLTYNGTPMTFLRADVSASTTVRSEIWYLTSPSHGNNLVAITLATASVSGASSTSYNNVSQNSPIDAQSGGTGVTGAGGGSASISTTTVTPGAWIVDAIAAPTTFTVGANQVQRANITGAVGNLGQSDKGAVVTPAATTMQWDNLTALTSWTMSTVALKPKITANMYISAVAGSLSFIGNRKQFITRPFTASLSFIGSVLKLIKRLLTGQSSFTGVFTNIHRHFASFTASLNLTGSFIKTSKRKLTGSLTSSGALSRLLKRLFAGQVSFTGTSFFKLIRIPFTASVSFTGIFKRSYVRILTGSLNFIGSQYKQKRQLFAASINLIGSFSKVMNKYLTASISFVSSFVSAIIKAFDKVLNPTKWTTTTKNHTSWTPTTKTVTMWRPKSGLGFVESTGSLKIVNKVGLILVNALGLSVVENPTQVVPKFATTWTKTLKNAASWRPRTGLGQVAQTGSLQLSTASGLLLVNASGLVVVENPTFVKPKNLTIWNPSGK